MDGKGQMRHLNNTNGSGVHILLADKLASGVTCYRVDHLHSRLPLMCPSSYFLASRISTCTEYRNIVNAMHETHVEMKLM